MLNAATLCLISLLNNPLEERLDLFAQLLCDKQVWTVVVKERRRKNEYICKTDKKVYFERHGDQFRAFIPTDEQLEAYYDDKVQFKYESDYEDFHINFPTYGQYTYTIFDFVENQNVNWRLEGVDRQNHVILYRKVKEHRPELNVDKKNYYAGPKIKPCAAP